MGSGLLSHIVRVGLLEQLLESGVTIRMSIGKGDTERQRLRLVCKGEDGGHGGSDHVYCSDHPEESGVIRFHSFCMHDRLPSVIWMEVEELDPTILANSLDKALRGSIPSRQTSMDQYGDIGIERAEDWCREPKGDSDEMDDCLLDFLERDRESARKFREFVLPGPED